MRKSTSFAEMMEIKRKTSTSQLSNSNASSKLTLSHCRSIQNGLRPMKGFSFGSSPRNSLMPINLFSPAAKYNIKGLVEINLSKKSGPSMKNGREDSVDKTTLSYNPNNSNPGPASYKTEVSRKSSAVLIGKQNNQNVSVEFLNERAINKNPGPGAYQSKVVKLKGGKITTKGARFEDNKENRPGPGTYNTNYVPMDAVSKGGSRIRTSTITLDC